MSKTDGARPSALWARLRFQIVGSLLAAPPEEGELRERLEELAGKSWRHPTTGESVRFGLSTIERWYYIAKAEPKDPVKALQRRIRKGAGQQLSVSAGISSMLQASHQKHPSWSYQLHYDNVAVLARKDESVGEMPSYTTVCRFFKSRGLVKQKKRRRKRQDAEPHVAREKRSFEVEYVHGLWHLDFHECSRSVLTRDARWVKPWVVGVLDDRSRLACHVQWYFVEDAQNLVHGLSQAILKRGLPRSLLTDNGGAMLAAETTQGLERLGIVHFTTLAETPEQNGKQECFWGQVEGRLMAMLEGVRDLTLPRLNQATQAWVELEYNRKTHSELGEAPLDCFRRQADVGRESPSSGQLRRAFRTEQQRTQRRSDGTISVEGRRFEIPGRYRTMLRPTIRYARWDLSEVELVDARSGAHLCLLYPLDKRKNASGRRSALEPVMTTTELSPQPDAGMAPLLEQLMADYAATGLPPAYLAPKTDEGTDDE
jgi:transposase InsO family protein